jgi:ATP-dependent helicase HepA
MPINDAETRLHPALRAEVQRLIDLGKINDHVRLTEVAFTCERLERTVEAIGLARLRVGVIRVVVEGPGLGA